VVIIALIVIFAAFIFLRNKNTSPSTQQPKSTSIEKITPRAMQLQGEVINITLADVGFTPRDITVKARTRVVWVNKSGQAATVNSYDHPTHRLYPFLNLGEFPSGSSVQAVVEKAGKYSYHNHYNASQTGTVTVE